VDHIYHKLLVGIVATMFYLVMTSLIPQSSLLPAAIAGYGTIHFCGTQILRIAGCTLGAVLHRKARV